MMVKCDGFPLLVPLWDSRYFTPTLDTSEELPLQKLNAKQRQKMKLLCFSQVTQNSDCPAILENVSVHCFHPPYLSVSLLSVLLLP